MIRKEIRTAVLCGVVPVWVCFLKIWLIDGLLLGNADITVAVNAVVCPFIASIVDALSLLVYFLFARLLLHV